MSPRKKTSSGRAFTVAFPRPLPADKRGDAWWMEADGRELRLSNLDKVFWPDEGYTKGDLLAFYYNVAELILPHLHDRPLTMKRMPDGVNGPFFYEKTAPSHTPDWIARCPVQSEDSKDGVIGYMMVQDLATLLFVVNLGAIEMHPLHSRCPSIESPDYLFFDLDPMGASFEDVLIVAQHVRAALGALGLSGYPKTSARPASRSTCRSSSAGPTTRCNFVGTLGRTIERADREHVTMAWQISKRTGKVFIDHNMNRSGANISAAYSLRPEAMATVSTPVTWDEIDAGSRRRTSGSRTCGSGSTSSATCSRACGHNRRTWPGARGGRAARAKAFADPSQAIRRTSEQVIAASKDPKLGEYLRKRSFGPEGTSEPAPGDATGVGTRS